MDWAPALSVSSLTSCVLNLVSPSQVVVMVIIVPLPLTTNRFSLLFSEIRLRIGLSDLWAKSTNDLPRAAPKAVTNRPFRPLPTSNFRYPTSESSLVSRLSLLDSE